MSQQGQGGKELLFAIAVPTEQQQFHKGTFLCKTPCLKALRTQEKVSFIGSEPQQQETVTAALVPLPVMSCQVLHSPVQHTCWMAHGKRLPFLHTCSTPVIFKASKDTVWGWTASLTLFFEPLNVNFQQSLL